MNARRSSIFAACAVALAAETAGAQARRRFNPEDLDLEKPGVVHADLAIGVMRGSAAGRWLVPDFDVDYGLTPDVELGIDGAWSVEGTSERLLIADHSAPDNLWFSSKVGIWDQKDAVSRTAWAAGLQLGPRVAAANDARGAGFQGLVLLGRAVRRAHVVFNAGGLVDPGADVSRGRPSGLLVGVDFTLDLDEQGEFSIAADASLVIFTSPDKNQLTSTAGLVWSVLPWLDVSGNGLFGVLAGGDRYGAWVGISPKVAVF